jgi:hypothetical protein
MAEERLSLQVMHRLNEKWSFIKIDEENEARIQQTILLIVMMAYHLLVILVNV